MDLVLTLVIILFSISSIMSVVFGLFDGIDVSNREMKKNKYKFNIPFRVGRRMALWYKVWGNKGGDEEAIKQPDWVIIGQLEDENNELKDKIRELEETITELYLTSDTDVRRNKA